MRRCTRPAANQVQSAEIQPDEIRRTALIEGCRNRILAGTFIGFESFLNRLGAPGASNLFRLMA
jgi:hypothetical protein